MTAIQSEALRLRGLLHAEGNKFRGDLWFDLSDSEKDDVEAEDFFETLLNSGQEVSYQDWDSGGPGAGAGRVSVYRYKDQFYSIHDAGMDGPFATSAEAVESSGINDINDATIAIWHEARGFTFRR